MGAGKTTVASQLAEICLAPHLQTDALRRAFVDPGAEPVGYGEGHYRLEQRDRVYQQMMRLGAEALRRSATVVLDGSFSQRQWRRAALDMAQASGARLWQVQCNCATELAATRITQRASAGELTSEARPELLTRQEQDYEAPLNTAPLTLIDTSARLPEFDAMVRAMLD